MFNSVWKRIRRLFLPMADSDSILILDAPYPHVSEYFFNEICNVSADVRSKYFVTELAWYKQRPSSSSSEHEFLVARVKGPKADWTSDLRVERVPAPEAPWKKVVLTASPSLKSGDVSALDTVECLGSARRTELNDSNDRVATLAFSDFPILEFVRILHVISHHNQNYSLDNTTCYWYVSMVVAIARRHFSNTGDNPSSRAGRFKGIKAHTIDPQKEEDMDVKYVAAREADPHPIGPREERARAALEERERELRAEAEERERELRAEAERERKLRAEAEERERASNERERESRAAEERERELRAEAEERERAANERERAANERERRMAEQVMALQRQLSM